MKMNLILLIAVAFVSIAQATDPVPKWRVPLSLPAGYDSSHADFIPDGAGGGAIVAQYFKYGEPSNFYHETPLALTKNIIWVSSSGMIRQQISLTISPPYAPLPYDIFPVSVTPARLVLAGIHGGRPANLKVYQCDGKMTETDISHLQPGLQNLAQKLDDVGYTNISYAPSGYFFFTQAQAVEYYRFQPSKGYGNK